MHDHLFLYFYLNIFKYKNILDVAQQIENTIKTQKPKLSWRSQQNLHVINSASI
jgi:Cdc6-like AAA superfamily ATPase